MFRVVKLGEVWVILNTEAGEYVRAADGSIWYSSCRQIAEARAERYNSRVAA